MNVVGGGLVLHINRLLEPVPFDFQNLQNSDQHESIWLELNHPESVRNSAGGPLQRPNFKFGIAYEDANSKDFYKNILSAIKSGIVSLFLGLNRTSRPVRKSGKFGCPVLSGQETHLPSPVEP